MRVTSKSNNRKWAALATALLLPVIMLAGCGQQAPTTEGSPASMKRLSEGQYRAIIANVFGGHISVVGRFDPLQRVGGLEAVGSRSASVTPFGLEEFGRMAASISEQVVSEENRQALVPCGQGAGSFDEQCVEGFMRQLGTLLYRRPLSEQELSDAVNVVRQSFELQNDFYAALASGIEWYLISPEFLFVHERTEESGGEQRLTALSKASRLSFFLWNTGPDMALIEAAAAGDLNTAKGLEAQVDRMMASPRFENGLRAFFTDMLELEKIDTLQKDPLIFPLFNVDVLRDAREQLLKDIAYHVIVEQAPYPDLFVSRKTFISPALARIYQVQVPQGKAWFQHEYQENEPRAGIHTQVSFVALHSHPGRSSPTLRGEAIRELLMCQTVPDPPADIDFTMFIDSDREGTTTRERLDIHNEQPACAGCHRITDPIGLALEQFDGVGSFRLVDNGLPIDPSGSLDGVDFEEPLGLASALSKNPSITQCISDRLYSYALAREIKSSDRDYLEYLYNEFDQEDYDLAQLIKRFVTGNEFFRLAEKR